MLPYVVLSGRRLSGAPRGSFSRGVLYDGEVEFPEFFLSITVRYGVPGVLSLYDGEVVDM